MAKLLLETGDGLLLETGDFLLLDDTYPPPPDPPTGLVATAASTTQVDLAWTAPVDTGGAPFTGYKIERESPTGGGWSTLVANTGSTGTTYSNTGLTPAVEYNYRVAAINALGVGPASESADARTFSNLPTSEFGGPTLCFDTLADLDALDTDVAYQEALVVQLTPESYSVEVASSRLEVELSSNLEHPATPNKIYLPLAEAVDLRGKAVVIELDMLPVEWSYMTDPPGFEELRNDAAVLLFSVGGEGVIIPYDEIYEQLSYPSPRQVTLVFGVFIYQNEDDSWSWRINVGFQTGPFDYFTFYAENYDGALVEPPGIDWGVEKFWAVVQSGTRTWTVYSSPTGLAGSWTLRFTGDADEDITDAEKYFFHYTVFHTENHQFYLAEEEPPHPQSERDRYPFRISGINCLPLTSEPGGDGTPSRPCALELTVYEADNVTAAWQVVTDAAYVGEGDAKPYLMEPTSYGEQEVDFAEGRASIGQVNVAVIDPRQIANDQDSGWMTERMIDVAGRRNRLRRWISEAAGWVTIADGPGSFPRLRPTFAGYEWSIRDTREKERKLRAFVKPEGLSAIPPGVIDGFGAYGDSEYPEWVSPPTDPIVAEYEEFGFLDYRALWPDEDPEETPPDELLITELAILAATPTREEYLGMFPLFDVDLMMDVPTPKYRRTFGNMRWRWREVGDTEWRYTGTPVYESFDSPIETIFDYTGDANNNGLFRTITGVLFLREDGTEVPHETDVEVYLEYRGPVSEEYPYLIDGLTAGEFLKNLYDGLYSPLDSLGEYIPTGIRYDADALLLMTTPVRLRITEPVDDVRGWAEENIYKPLGYAPAFDSDGLISPVSQIPPDSLRSSDVIDNSITAPVPGHTPGDNVINVLNFKYQRVYADPARDATETLPAYAGSESADRLSVRDIEIEYRNESSIERFGPQEWKVETSAFVALGIATWTETGRLKGVAAIDTPETGAALAEARDTHLADRRAYGTDLVVVPVMRVPTSHMRAGGWVRVLLSWVPNQLTGRRSLDHLGQITAIKDLNCAWREMTIELVSGWGDANPYDYESLGHVENPDEPGALYFAELEAFAPTEEGSSVVTIRARVNDNPDGYRIKLFGRGNEAGIGPTWTEISEQVTPYAHVMPIETQDYLWGTEWPLVSASADAPISLEVRGDIVKIATGETVGSSFGGTVTWNIERD